MTAQLTGFPKGLLSLVESQSFGENVREMATTLAPTLELTDLYLASRLEIVFGSPAAVNLANGFNSIAACQVPAGELWRVYMGNAAVVSPVAATGRFSPAVRINGGSLILGNQVDYLASTTSWSMQTPAAFWAPSGAELGLFGAQVVGASPCSAQFWISRLKG